jgi:hypothetical protein
MRPCGHVLDKDVERVLDVLDQSGGTSSVTAMLNVAMMLSKSAVSVVMMLKS